MVDPGLQGALAQNNQTLAGYIAGNLVWALAAYLEYGLYLVWLAVTWVVIELYTLIGSYIIPIWDFSNGAGLYNLPAESGAYGVVSVSPQASQCLWYMVPYLVSVCGFVMLVLSALAVPRSLLHDRQPFEGVAGLVWGASLMVVYPLLYSVPIHIGNTVAREFYTNAQSYYSSQSSGPKNLFNALMVDSLFPNQAAMGAGTLSAATGQLATGFVGTNSTGITSTDGLSAAFSNAMGQIFGTGGVKQNISNIAAIAVQSVGSNLAMQGSRFVQVILCVWGCVELIGVLMVKGGQVIAMILNFYLGWIACALYVLPSTRAVFWGWLRNHVQLCLWGLVWGMMIFAMNIIVLAGNSMQGMSTDATGLQIFQGVGLFLMPFLLFGCIHKFRDVASLVTGLSASSQLARQTGVAVRTAFMQSVGPRGPVPQALSVHSQKGSSHQDAGTVMADSGRVWAEGMQAVAMRASSGLKIVPGVGTAAAAAVQNLGGGLATATQAGSAAMGKQLGHVNLFRLRTAVLDRQRTPNVNMGKGFAGRQGMA
jgi:hypothetical protein